MDSHRQLKEPTRDIFDLLNKFAEALTPTEKTNRSSFFNTKTSLRPLAEDIIKTLLVDSKKADTFSLMEVTKWINNNITEENYPGFSEMVNSIVSEVDQEYQQILGSKQSEPRR